MPSNNPQTPQSPNNNSFTSIPGSGSSPIGNKMSSNSLPTPMSSVHGVPNISGRVGDDKDIENDDPSNKRKREAEDSGERDQKKVHIEDGRPGIDDLHKVVGRLYLLCQTPHHRTLPDVRSDLFATYKLEGLAAEVARIKPNGEKNGLRKTYKKQIKDLGIAGKFDAVKHEPDTPGGLLDMVLMPDEIWESQSGPVQNMQSGLSSVARTRLPKAMTMARGSIPKSQWDPVVLGLDQPAAATSNAAKQSTMAGAQKYTAPATQRLTKVENLRRPSRNAKKRTYTDDSFAGYGEGYVDDNMADDPGYSTGDGDDRSGQKRRKKDQSHHFPGHMRQQSSYGPGMVGA